MHLYLYICAVFSSCDPTILEQCKAMKASMRALHTYLIDKTIPAKNADSFLLLSKYVYDLLVDKKEISAYYGLKGNIKRKIFKIACQSYLREKIDILDAALEEPQLELDTNHYDAIQYLLSREMVGSVCNLDSRYLQKLDVAYVSDNVDKELMWEYNDILFDAIASKIHLSADDRTYYAAISTCMDLLYGNTYFFMLPLHYKHLNTSKIEHTMPGNAIRHMLKIIQIFLSFMECRINFLQRMTKSRHLQTYKEMLEKKYNTIIHILSKSEYLDMCSIDLNFMRGIYFDYIVSYYLFKEDNAITGKNPIGTMRRTASSASFSTLNFRERRFGSQNKCYSSMTTTKIEKILPRRLKQFGLKDNIRYENWQLIEEMIDFDLVVSKFIYLLGNDSQNNKRYEKIVSQVIDVLQCVAGTDQENMFVRRLVSIIKLKYAIK